MIRRRYGTHANHLPLPEINIRIIYQYVQMCQDVYMIYTHTITCRCLGEVMDCKDVAGNGVDSCGPATPKGPHPGTSSDGGWINEPGPHLGESSERGPAAVTECNRGDGRADPKPPTPPPGLQAGPPADSESAERIAGDREGTARLS